MIRFAVDHPVATWMLFAALIVTGRLRRSAG